jgi:hypothetical protein
VENFLICSYITKTWRNFDIITRVLLIAQDFGSGEFPDSKYFFVEFKGQRHDMTNKGNDRDPA